MLLQTPTPPLIQGFLTTFRRIPCNRTLPLPLRPNPAITPPEAKILQSTPLRAKKISLYLVLKGQNFFAAPSPPRKHHIYLHWRFLLDFWAVIGPKIRFLATKRLFFAKTAPAAPFSGASRPKILQSTPPPERKVHPPSEGGKKILLWYHYYCVGLYLKRPHSFQIHFTYLQSKNWWIWLKPINFSCEWHSHDLLTSLPLNSRFHGRKSLVWPLYHRKLWQYYSWTVCGRINFVTPKKLKLFSLKPKHWFSLLKIKYFPFCC